MVEELIGRLPELTESQLGRLEDELRRERQGRASSEGDRMLLVSRRVLRRLSRKFWSTALTKMAICS